MSTATLSITNTRERLLTAADLARLPTSLPSGEVCYELDNGKLVIIAPPGDVHGFRQAMICFFLALYGQERGHGEMRAEVGIVLQRNPDRVVGADAAFILKESLPVRRSPEGYPETIAELVVEIRSKNDADKEIAARNEEYFDAGVKVVWLIDSDAQLMRVCRQGQPEQSLGKGDTLTCELIPGFAVPVARLFAGD